MSEAHSYLSSKAQKVRADGHELAKPGLKVKTVDEPTIAVPEFAACNDWGSVNANFDSTRAAVGQLQEVVRALFAQIAALKEGTKKSLRTLAAIRSDSRVSVLQEETNTLWWLFGEYSHDLEKPLLELDPTSACLVIGKELAGCSDILPPPVAANAFLARGFRSNRQSGEGEVSLQRVVNAADAEWRKTQVRATRLGVEKTAGLTPVHLALAKAVATAGEQSWVTEFDENSGLSHQILLTPEKWARQIYTECNLLRSLSVAE